MKKQLPTLKGLFILALAGIVNVNLIAQTPITNGSFENWEDVPVAFVPDNWEVEKDDEIADLVNTRMNEATEGDYSLKLETIIDGDLGFAVLGVVGDEGPEGGIPWTEEVDELRFDVKYSTEGSDASVVMVQFSMLLEMKLGVVPKHLREVRPVGVLMNQ
jgi:hypothetical protein